VRFLYGLRGGGELRVTSDPVTEQPASIVADPVRERGVCARLPGRHGLPVGSPILLVAPGWMPR